MKYTYRLPPCPSNDIEGMESWLSDLALQGLMLTEDGFFFGLGIFERSTPKKVRYRLTAAEAKPTLFNDYDSPAEEAVDICREMGWDFVCRRGSFYIYRTESPSAPELNSDPEILALTLNKLKKQQRNDIIASFAWIIFYTGLQLTAGKHLFWVSWLQLGTVVFALAFLFLLMLLTGRLVNLHRISKLRKKLLSQGDLDHSREYRSGTGRYYAGKIASVLITVIFTFALLNTFYVAITECDQVKLSDHPGNFPFATATDFVEGDYRETPVFVPNSVRCWSDVLSPVNYDFHEQATITRSDGILWEINLYIDYHQTIHPWIAQQVAEDYLRITEAEHHIPLDAAALGVDYASACTDHGLNITLRKGNIVLHAAIGQYGDVALTPDELAGVLAQSIG